MSKRGPGARSRAAPLAISTSRRSEVRYAEGSAVRGARRKRGCIQPKYRSPNSGLSNASPAGSEIRSKSPLSARPTIGGTISSAVSTAPAAASVAATSRRLRRVPVSTFIGASLTRIRYHARRGARDRHRRLPARLRRGAPRGEDLRRARRAGRPARRSRGAPRRHRHGPVGPRPRSAVRRRSFYSRRSASSLLLFEVGLETDLAELLRVGGPALAVALAGMVLPFTGGYFLTRALGYEALTAIFVGAALTATSIGITARVLSELGALKTREGQIILGRGGDRRRARSGRFSRSSARSRRPARSRPWWP